MLILFPHSRRQLNIPIVIDEVIVGGVEGIVEEPRVGCRVMRWCVEIGFFVSWLRGTNLGWALELWRGLMMMVLCWLSVIYVLIVYLSYSWFLLKRRTSLTSSLNDDAHWRGFQVGIRLVEDLFLEKLGMPHRSIKQSLCFQICTVDALIHFDN
jgi:hypothetical protein